MKILIKKLARWYVRRQLKNAKASDTPVTWKSDYQDLQITYFAPWVKIGSLDNGVKLVFGLIDQNNGQSYVIKINEISQIVEQTLEEYYAEVISHMLLSNEDNQFLEENEASLFDEAFYQFVFLLHTEKWGILKSHIFIRRTEKFNYAVQMSYPVDESEARTAVIPDELMELTKTTILKIR